MASHIVIWEQTPSLFSASLRFSWSRLPHTKICCASLGKKLAAWGLSAWRCWDSIKWDVNLPRVNLCTLFPCANPYTWQKEIACCHKNLGSRFSNCPGSLGSILVHWAVQADLCLVTRCICQLQPFFPACELISHCHLHNWVVTGVDLWYRTFCLVDIRAIHRWRWVLSSPFNWWENSNEKKFLKSSRADSHWE